LSIAEADAVVPEVLAFAGQPRTNAEMEASFDERLGSSRGRASGGRRGRSPGNEPRLQERV